MAQFAIRHHAAAGLDIAAGATVLDHENPIAAAAMGWLDDKGGLVAQGIGQLADGVLGSHDAIKLRHGDTGLLCQCLGLQLVIHQRVKPARIVAHDEIGIALVHREDAGLSKYGAGPPHQSCLPAITARNRQNSDSR